MASITLTGTLLDPTGEVAVGDQIRFTHRTTTGETIQFARSVLIIPPNGLYNITLEFGLIFVEYLDIKDVHYKNLGVVTVNGDTTATDLPGLLNAIVPPTDAQLLLFQGILADTEDARDIALLAAAQQTTLELIASTTTHPNSTVLTLSGHTLPGDGVGGKWQLNGVVGQTPNQSPTQLADFLLNDGNGNQWALVDGVVLAFNGVQLLPLPFGATGNGNYAYNNNDFDKITDPDRLNPATLAIWQNDTSAQLDDVVTTAERATGDGGGGKGDVIASGTANGTGIVAHNTLPLSFELRTDGRVNVEQFGVNTSNSAAVNTPIFHAAWNLMAGRQIYMKNRTYEYSGSYSGIVNLTGEQRPTVNATRTALENGSILEGSTNFSGNYVYLVDIGVDHGSDAFPSTGADAVKVSASPFNSGRLAVLSGVVGIGRNNTDAFHGILVEGYEQAWVTECVGCKNQFAGAIKSRNIEVDGFRAIEGQTMLIVKSDTGVAAGQAANVNVSNLNLEGNATETVHALRILSDNNALERLNVNGVNITESDRAITLEATTTLNEVNISNVNASGINLFGIVTSGVIRNINMTNINMVELDDFAAQFLSGGNISLNNAYFSLKPTSTRVTDAIRVESGVTGFTANNLKVIENRDNGILRGINFANARTQNNLTQVTALQSTNIPEPGFQVESVDDGVITLEFEPNRLMSTVDATNTGAVDVTQITTQMPDTTTNFPRGYQVWIRNASGGTLTFKDNANMLMKNNADQPRLTNQMIGFTFISGVWLQLDHL